MSRRPAVPAPRSSGATRRRRLTSRHQQLLTDALMACSDDQESRELLAIVQEAEEVLVDLPEGSRWT